MSDRLDRIEAGLDETRKIVESNSRAIEAWANESVEYKRQTTAAIGRLTSISEQLAQLITTLAARQQDQENRIDRLEP
jgi:chromosome segregation ATPase